MISVDARKTKKLHKCHKDSGNGHTRGSHHTPCPAPAPIPHYDPHPTQVNTFDIMSFGAKGNGVSDDSEVTKKHSEL